MNVKYNTGDRLIQVPLYGYQNQIDLRVLVHSDNALESICFIYCFFFSFYFVRLMTSLNLCVYTLISNSSRPIKTRFTAVHCINLPIMMNSSE